MPGSSQVPLTTRNSTAFSTPNQTEITDFDPRDISVDSDDESFVCPSDPEEEVRGTHTPLHSQVRSHHFGSFFIEHSEEQNSDSEDENKTAQSSNRNRNEIQLPPLVMNSPADLIKLVPTRSKSKKSEPSLQSGLRNFIILTVTLAILAKIHLTKTNKKANSKVVSRYLQSIKTVLVNQRKII